MESFAALLRYFCVKLLVSIFRFIGRIAEPRRESSRDSILSIPSRDKERSIKVNVYRSSNASADKPLPVLINFFGGGFVLPLHGADDYFCRRMADEAGYIVLDVDYRLAPENPFPAAINDAEDAIKYVLDHPQAFDTSSVSVSGFSSGGTCALAALSLFPRDTFKAAVTFYPSTNAAQDPSLRKAPVQVEGGKQPPAFLSNLFRNAYFGNADPRDPRISPIHADVSAYPKHMVMVTAEMDGFALEAEALAERASGEGNRNVVIRRMKHVGHNFDKQASDACQQAREESYGLAVQTLRAVNE